MFLYISYFHIFICFYIFHNSIFIYLFIHSATAVRHCFLWSSRDLQQIAPGVKQHAEFDFGTPRPSNHQKRSPKHDLRIYFRKFAKTQDFSTNPSSFWSAFLSVFMANLWQAYISSIYIYIYILHYYTVFLISFKLCFKFPLKLHFDFSLNTRFCIFSMHCDLIFSMHRDQVSR